MTVSPSTHLQVIFALNACSLDLKLMPKPDGIVVVPIYPAGSWYVFCSRPEIATQLVSVFDCEVEDVFGVEALVLSAGDSHDSAQLENALQQVGYDVQFLNTEPWLQLS